MRSVTGFIAVVVCCVVAGALFLYGVSRSVIVSNCVGVAAYVGVAGALTSQNALLS